MGKPTLTNKLELKRGTYNYIKHLYQLCKKCTMEAIILTFNINTELSLVDNTKLLLKRTSLSAF